ncbi:peptide-methionine (S)-S-oxide reductase MsrA [Herminiimonas fonticola]|uniref:Peptide methionine sulfoxide reductase MsrA n=1 Tax=Herminiimonas fonticola TaxID=303380 RepID=A0A4R6GGG7_9BURK|nr:peptide-methionine (S)-S-oxide reductase MsrA [Herminiimonas fonticola]RBA24915.1 msrA: peptide-methionine (S)-S-oxide reductase [Herminiimonas fonticola]TDN94029.1 peptide-methionine (S)-S-oxide reductase [Herminiimonas fonticola]
MKSSNSKLATKIAFLSLLALGSFTSATLHAAEAPVVIASPALDNAKAKGALQTAVFAGGCFWGVEGVFEHVRGVRNVVSGYAGGDKANANYNLVSRGSTGHAEAVQITFDPAEVSYGELLQIFFSVAHDPTQLNRQGPDTGTQYRSAVFYTDATQKKLTEAYVAQLNQAHVFRRDIVTQINALKEFYPAEDYHQNFLQRNPRHPYIVYNDLPKISNLKRIFPAVYVDEPIASNKPTTTK